MAYRKKRCLRVEERQQEERVVAGPQSKKGEAAEQKCKLRYAITKDEPTRGRGVAAPPKKPSPFVGTNAKLRWRVCFASRARNPANRNQTAEQIRRSQSNKKTRRRENATTRKRDDEKTRRRENAKTRKRDDEKTRRGGTKQQAKQKKASKKMQAKKHKIFSVLLLWLLSGALPYRDPLKRTARGFFLSKNLAHKILKGLLLYVCPGYVQGSPYRVTGRFSKPPVF
jgi:hypothetical protein